jgi:anti-sigma B factor antagonist
VAAPAKRIRTTVGEPQARALLEIQDVACGHAQTLRLTGEVDLASAPLLDSAVRKICMSGTATALVLDLAEVRFMDSAGLHAILRAKTLCTSCGMEIRVLPGCAQVQRLFEITGVQELIFGTPGGSGS